MSDIARATRWASAGLLSGALGALLLMRPFSPQDPINYEALGWAMLTLAVGAALGLLVGTAALWRGLRGAEGRGTTVLLFVPLAVALGAVSIGVGALLAAPLARWLVERRSKARWQQAGAARAS